jgi:hypothetical protein
MEEEEGGEGKENQRERENMNMLLSSLVLICFAFFILQVWNSHPKKYGPGSRQW